MNILIGPMAEVWVDGAWSDCATRMVTIPCDGLTCCQGTFHRLYMRKFT